MNSNILENNIKNEVKNEVGTLEEKQTHLSKWAAEIRSIRAKLSMLSVEHATHSRAHLESIVSFNTGIFYTGLFFSFMDWSTPTTKSNPVKTKTIIIPIPIIAITGSRTA